MSTSTTDVAATATRRLSSPDAFFGCFAEAWKKASEIVRKVETRQDYREPGNPSWERLAAGDFDDAVRTVPDARAADVPLYESLRQRGVHFVRCRPVGDPISLYLRWEIACYDFNAAHGEEILFAPLALAAPLLRDRIHHDFMVFDQNVAFIHDYDSTGEIRGGWMVTNKDDIAALIEMFEELEGLCVPYSEFLGRPR